MLLSFNMGVRVWLGPYAAIEQLRLPVRRVYSLWVYLYTQAKSSNKILILKF